MNAVVVLNWQFSPANYFGEPIRIDCHDHSMIIADGKAEARIGSAAYDEDSSMREALHEELEDRFLAAQLVDHRAYELSKSRMTRVNADGHKEVYVEDNIGVSLRASIAIQVLDKDGNVVVDSKRNRSEKIKSLQRPISAHRPTDVLLDSLLQSFHTAINDPGNELVHLYEIRDALGAKFGDERKAASALNISRGRWSRFGELCNTGPLRQGRHRGKSAGALRAATEGELEEARGIAQGMIEAYLQYLDRN